MHGEISGRTVLGEVHPVGAPNKTLISVTAMYYVIDGIVFLLFIIDFNDNRTIEMLTL